MMTCYELLTKLQIDSIARAILLVILGFFTGRLVSLSFNKALGGRLTLQQAMLLRRILFYLIFLLFLASAIQQLGFHISALLGATGILTVALGIASQTSMSNMISGVFIIGEKPFEIGDTIKVNDLQGEVIAIDYLSVKIRTSENTMARIPNEMLIKSAITNISYFPIRRADLLFNVAYSSDIDQVKDILFKTAKENDDCLADPKPTVLVLNMGDAAITIQFSVWSRKEVYNELKSTLLADVKNAFIKNNIDMPFRSHSFYIGNAKIIAQDKID